MLITLMILAVRARRWLHLTFCCRSSAHTRCAVRHAHKATAEEQTYSRTVGEVCTTADQHQHVRRKLKFSGWKLRLQILIARPTANSNSIYVHNTECCSSNSTSSGNYAPISPSRGIHTDHRSFPTSQVLAGTSSHKPHIMPTPQHARRATRRSRSSDDAPLTVIILRIVLTPEAPGPAQITEHVPCRQ